jgi:hypothetical protein
VPDALRHVLTQRADCRPLRCDLTLTARRSPREEPLHERRDEHQLDEQPDDRLRRDYRRRIAQAQR